MFRRVKIEEFMPISVEKGLGGDHFGVEQGVAGQLPQKVTKMAIGVIHHRSNTEGITARGKGRGHRKGWPGNGEVKLLAIAVKPV
jgi:hypothetical protein